MTGAELTTRLVELFDLVNARYALMKALTNE